MNRLRRWTTILLAISLVCLAIGLWRHAVSAYRYLIWASVPATVVGEGEPVQVRVGKANVAKLRVRYEFVMSGSTYGGDGIVSEIPGDRLVKVRHSRDNPAKNGIDVGPPRWAGNLMVGGGLMALLLYAIRSGMRAAMGERRGKNSGRRPADGSYQ